ncbi:uncharacterized protein L969DRAFT_105970 [Mixia osmundae IAM 14324]|uniref:SH3 domain-containing protein n=1 Tax=Mixia osmundae (strain CBS 9802 / IAM 14324 / JCM 22182 / KY 12970) TaxID=764103 RepID=G7DV63_MIXOS|nr:uncharacterized protein L969DRAFT_105970 [Mixia osmundae IAM 14324]KEI36311.1 hypothetical protein L969DRAFT_105970 [Mixia osmundae IAM 14324]GAA94473.1 hypothetical protein E5Q_01125 [Mixia osmundae IAM 14324]
MGFGHNPLPQNLALECRRASKTLQSFVDASQGLDGIIPTEVLRAARGFAIYSVVKAGFLASVRAGSGLVIARLANGTWSAPSAIGTGGLGFGGQAGAEQTDVILILNSKSAVESFMSAGSISIGGNMSVAVGPLGRNAEGAGNLNTKGKIAAIYSYSKTRGLFGGVSVEGSVIVERSDCNGKAYGTEVSAKQLLSGNIEVPPFAEQLIATITRLAGSNLDGNWVDDSPKREKGDYAFGGKYHSSSQAGSRSPAASGSSKNHFNTAFRNLSDDEDDDGRPAFRWKNSQTSNISDDEDPFKEPSSYDQKKQRARERGGSLGSANQKARFDADDDPFAAIGGQTDTTKVMGVGGHRSESGRRSTVTGSHSRPSETSPFNERNSQRPYKSHTNSPRRDRFDQHNGPSPLRSRTYESAEDDEDDLVNRDQINFSGEPVGSLSSYNNRRPGVLRLISNSMKGGKSTPPLPAINDMYNDTSRRNRDSFDEDLQSFSRRSPKSTSSRYSQDTSRLDSPQSPGDSFNFAGQKTRQTGTHLGSARLSQTLKTDTKTRETQPAYKSLIDMSDSSDDLGKAIALFDYNGQAGDLSFKRNDVITIVARPANEEWWTGSIGSRKGSFPAREEMQGMTGLFVDKQSSGWESDSAARAEAPKHLNVSVIYRSARRRAAFIGACVLCQGWHVFKSSDQKIVSSKADVWCIGDLERDQRRIDD